MSEGYYKHIDGGIYYHVLEAKSSDNGETLVIYDHVWPFEWGTYARKKEEFQARFSPIEPSEAFGYITMSHEERSYARDQITITKAARRRKEAAQR